MNFYRICGLNVASELGLPGAAAIEAGPADVTVRIGAVPHALAGASEVHATYALGGGKFLLRIPGIARYLSDGGHTLTVAPEGSAQGAACFIPGTVFGLLMQQRGDVVLQAGAVRLGDAAVLLMGPSGTGKSTLLAALAARGFDVLGDNLCRIVLVDGAPVAHPDASRIQLWSQSFDKAGLSVRRGDPVRPGIEKFFAETPVKGAALPLAGAYVLRETRPPARDGILHPNIVDQTILARRGAFRQRAIALFGGRQRYLTVAAAIAAKPGVFLFDRPLDLAALAPSTDTLVDYWRARGLMGAAP